MSYLWELWGMGITVSQEADGGLSCSWDGGEFVLTPEAVSEASGASTGIEHHGLGDFVKEGAIRGMSGYWYWLTGTYPLPDGKIGEEDGLFSWFGDPATGKLYDSKLIAEAVLKALKDMVPSPSSWLWLLAGAAGTYVLTKKK